PDAVTAQSSSSEQAVRGYTGTVAVIQDSNISAPPSTAIPMRARKQTTTATSSKEVRPFPARSGLVTSRAPRVTAAHARSLCILSTGARIWSPPATLNAMLWPVGIYHADRGRREIQRFRKVDHPGFGYLGRRMPAVEAFRTGGTGNYVSSNVGD